MKKGGRLASASGFTIVETLIVLAVSSMLFVIAATMISGRQAKTEFQVASRDIQTKLQQVINETKSGYSGSDSTDECASSGTVNPPGLLFTPSTNGLGTRGTCIFIGKALVVDQSSITTYPLAGLRQAAGVDTSDAKTARATVIPNSASVYSFPYGMTLVGSAVNGAGLGAATTTGFAVLTSFSDTSALGGQTFRLHAIKGSFTVPSQYENTINNEIISTNPTPYEDVSSVTLCMKSGGTNQSLKVTIGGEDGTSVQTEVKGNTSCAD